MSAIRLIQPSPVPEVVSCLREMLERAERGEVVGVVVAFSTHGRGTGSTYATGDIPIADLYVAVDRLKARLLDH